MKLNFYFLLVLLLGTAPAAADNTLSQFSFDTPGQEQAFRELTEELRCLVCQNESLAGSQAELAQDLRDEVYGMLKEGKSKSDIVTWSPATVISYSTAPRCGPIPTCSGSARFYCSPLEAFFSSAP